MRSCRALPFMRWRYARRCTSHTMLSTLQSTGWTRSRIAASLLVASVGACGDSDGLASEGSTSSSPTSTSFLPTFPTSSETSVESTAATAGADTGPAGPPGELSFLTYNVAGLPQGISGSNPERNIPQISPLLNDFDLVVVQEDFWYHPELVADVMHSHQSQPWSQMPVLEDIGDGLNRFSESAFELHERIAWYDCHGQVDCASDCLATKGWSFARHTLAPGVEVDVYNLHNEAGSCPEDLTIREQTAMDLVAGIAQRSGDRAVIVAGDFNLHVEDPADTGPLQTILDGAGLSDACDAVDCGDQRIDRIMVRSGPDLQLEVLSWSIPEGFVDARTGEPLSDHLPVAATIRYTPL